MVKGWLAINKKERGDKFMIRKVTSKDISRIAEILVFTKLSSYRGIFQNDKVSLGTSEGAL